MSKQLYRSTATVSSMSLLSRILGFVRDMLIANIFGVSAATDAFFAAFKIPNLLRRLYTEGAYSHALIPLLAEQQQKADSLSQKRFIDNAAGTLTALLLLLTLVGMLAAPALVTLLAPGFLNADGEFDLAVQLLRISFPYLFFISLTGLAGALLNAKGRFALPAITPVVLNICLIAAALWLAPLCREPVTALAWGIVIAGVLQLALQLPALHALNLLPRLRWGASDPEVRRLLHLMLPAIFGISVTQLNQIFGTLVASCLETGSVSWLYYSERLVEFPQGILGVAVATVILPSLSNNHAAEDPVAFSASLDWGLKIVLLVGVPATLGLVLLADPLLSTLFEYREFDRHDVLMASESLIAFAFGLLAFTLIKVFIPGFTSRLDTRSPVRFGLYSIIGNAVLSVMLAWPFAHAGIAWAATLAAYLNAGLLFFTLYRQGVYRPRPGWQSFGLRIAFASTAMALFLMYFVKLPVWHDWSAAQRALHLSGTVGIAMGVYAAALWLGGIRPQHLQADGAGL
ncbi:murein biosynthesis integral membrane protein MurJ [Methylomonas sp. HYX-M1]|uniref:murein biosynthesis integral membrane protein MurJ n=1 Tax=Methylomonas sp. HYX-M1 TaxID=3139307 RepID=UPI00345C0F20